LVLPTMEVNLTRETICFDDVLLEPQYSDIDSRTEVSLDSYLVRSLPNSLPVSSSPMDTVTETDMARAMSAAGGLGIIHRYNSIQEQVTMIEEALKGGARHVGAAVGVTGAFQTRAREVISAGAKIICIDIAHGHHSLMEMAIKGVRKEIGSAPVHLMAGNVATREAFDDLAKWGADSIRVGIGGGSICSTRLVTGHGVPTFQSILDCSDTEYDAKIIADGGIKTTGDMVKAFAAGADFVMIGSMLAGVNETPGDIFKDADGKRYKVYRGMASRAAQERWRGTATTPEGVSTTVPYKGTAADILSNIKGGICSGLSYSGARNIEKFRFTAKFLKQTVAGSRESNTHILS